MKTSTIPYMAKQTTLKVELNLDKMQFENLVHNVKITNFCFVEQQTAQTSTFR